MAGQRILILRGGAIGDFVLTLPAIEALRVRWPSAHIDLYGYPHIATLAEAGGLVDQVASIDRAELVALFVRDLQPSRELTDWMRSYDLIISYLYDPDEFVLENLKTLGARQVLYGNPRPYGEHAADWFCRPLAELAIYPTPATPRLILQPEQRAKGAERLQALSGAAKPRCLAIHPGSGGALKRWPLESYLELAERLRNAGEWQPLFLFGEADQELLSSFEVRGIDFPRVSDASLLDIAALLTACAAYIGNDSGITHLAAALGLPTLALYGPTDPAIWGVRGRMTTRQLRAPATQLKQLSVEQVFEQLTPILEVGV